MTSFFRWRLVCKEEGVNKFVVQEESVAAPTECPDDAGHEVSDIIIETTIPIAYKNSTMLTPIKDEWRPTDTDGFKEFVCALVDIETNKRIQVGFEWPAASGKILSMSDHAQANWLGLLSDPTLPTYPFDVSTLDNKDKASVADQAAGTSLAQAAYSYKESKLTAGNAIKTSVRAAASIADIFTAASNYLNGN